MNATKIDFLNFLKNEKKNIKKEEDNLCYKARDKI